MNAVPPVRRTVLHVDAERGWRGGEQHVLWLAQALERLGHRSLIAARPGEPLAKRAARAGIAVVPCAPAGEISPRATFALRRAIRRERVDIVHAHTGHAVALAALATLGGTAKMVVTRHVDFPLRNALSRWKYGRADAVLAVSAAVARSLQASGIPAERVTVIAGGVDLAHAAAAAPRTRLAEFGIPEGAPLAVMVAALVSQKDPLTYVRAIARARHDVPALHALLVGEGPLRSEVEAEIARLGLGGAVHLAGYREDADALMAPADVVVLSSRNEGLPVVLLNALALGKPIASTDAGGVGDMLRAGDCGLVVPAGDAGALGGAIARILTDRELARRFGAAARSHAEEYSIDRVAARTAAVYDRVSGPGP